LLIGVACWLPARAQASPLLELTGDLGGEGGLIGRHGGAGAFSTYFNPALLPRARPGLSLRLLVVHDDIDIDPVARDDASTRVDVSAAGAFRDDGDLTPVFPSPLPTTWLQQGCTGDCEAALVADPAQPRPRQGRDSSENLLAHAGVGLVQPVLPERVVLGLSLFLPLSKLLAADAFYNDEREQYFSNSLHPELYSDRLTSLSVAFGAGVRVLDELSAGVSFSLNLDNRARSPTFVPEATAYDALSLSNRVGVEAQLSPHFGLAFEPVENLLLTATLHTEQKLQVEAAFSSFLPDGSEQFAVRRFTHHFVPLTAALGAGYGFDVGAGELEVTAGASFERWSTYRDRHDQRPSGDYAFSDRVQPSLGMRHRIADWTSGLDATYRVSPVPAQRGRTNYVDNDRLGLSALLQRELTLGELSLQLGAGLQFHHLIDRSQRKRVPEAGADDPDRVRDEVPDDAVQKLDIEEPVQPRQGLQTNNPGFPGFESGGYLLGASLRVALLF
jgi:hypothetical protein